MANNNNDIFDAALTGMVGGLAAARTLTSGTASHYAGIKNAAIAFATQVDSLIPTASFTDAADDLMFAICIGYWSARFGVSGTPTDYSAEASAVVALWTEASGGLA